MSQSSWDEDQILALIGAEQNLPDVQQQRQEMMKNDEARSMYESFTEVELSLSESLFEQAEATLDGKAPAPLPEAIQSSLLRIGKTDGTDSTSRPSWFQGIFSRETKEGQPTNRHMPVQGMALVAMAACIALVVGIGSPYFMEQEDPRSVISGTQMRGEDGPTDPFFLVLRPKGNEGETKRVALKSKGLHTYHATVPMTASIQLRVYATEGLTEGSRWHAEGHLFGIKTEDGEDNKELLAGPQHLSAEGIVDDIDLSLGQAISIPALASRGYQDGDRLHFEVQQSEGTYHLIVHLESAGFRQSP